MFSGHKPLAVITGGSDGIGLAIAVALAQSQMDLVLVARNPGRLEATVRHPSTEHGIDAVPVAVDLSQTAVAVERVAQAVHQRVASQRQHLSVLVHNAGIGWFTPFAEVAEPEFDLQLDFNLRTPFFLTQSLRELLIDAHGAIVKSPVEKVASTAVSNGM